MIHTVYTRRRANNVQTLFLYDALMLNIFSFMSGQAIQVAEANSFIILMVKHDNTYSQVMSQRYNTITYLGLSFF